MMIERTQSAQFKTQQGATLIAVLFVLLLITIVGVMGIRQGMTRLNLTTNAQINTLLDTMADVAIQKVLAATKAQYGVATGFTQMLAKAGSQDELFFCYKPTTNSTLFARGKAGLFAADPAGLVGTVQGDTRVVSPSADVNQTSLTAGVCDLSNDSSSARNLGVTQIAIMKAVKLVGTSDAGFTSCTVGADCDVASSAIGSPDGGSNYTVFATSIISPSVISYPASSVQSNCLATRLNFDLNPNVLQRESLTECLLHYGVPSVTRTQDFSINQTTAVTGL